VRWWQKILAVLAVPSVGAMGFVIWQLVHAPSPSQRAAEALAAAAVGTPVPVSVPVADEALIGMRRYRHDLQRHQARTGDVLNELGNYHGRGDGTWIFRLGASMFAREASASTAALAADVTRFLTAIKTSSPVRCCGAFVATSCRVELPDPSAPRAWDREAKVHCVDDDGWRLSFLIVEGVVVQVVPDVFIRTAQALDAASDGERRTPTP
jgi:hypothetical protein